MDVSQFVWVMVVGLSIVALGALTVTVRATDRRARERQARQDTAILDAINLLRDDLVQHGRLPEAAESQDEAP